MSLALYGTAEFQLYQYLSKSSRAADDLAERGSCEPQHVRRPTRWIIFDTLGGGNPPAGSQKTSQDRAPLVAASPALFCIARSCTLRGVREIPMDWEPIRRPAEYISPIQAD